MKSRSVVRVCAQCHAMHSYVQEIDSNNDADVEEEEEDDEGEGGDGLFEWNDEDHYNDDSEYNRVWVERHAVQDASRRFHA